MASLSLGLQEVDVFPSPPPLNAFRRHTYMWCTKRKACMCAVKFDRAVWLVCEVMSDTRSNAGDVAHRMVDAEPGEEAAPERPFLVDPPGPEVAVRGIVCLDFDGVLNKISPSRRDRLPQVVKDGHSWGIDLDSDILAGLDTVIQRPGIWLAWTTTWGSQISLVRPLFNGHLDGGFVAAERPQDFYVDICWKEQTVVHLAERFPNAKLAWIDDTAVPESFQFGSATQRLSDALLIAPDSSKGLQMDEIAAIEEFFELSGE